MAPMLQPEAIARFVDKQKLLLRRTYDAGWHRGVDTYHPDPDPVQQPTVSREMATVGLTGAALLLARRRYAYVPPVHPDGVRRAVALAPSYRGLNRMATELVNLSMGAAPEIVTNQGDLPQAVSDWAETNAYRLDAGASVAWAGEQAGFAEAADADGQFLYSWTSVGDTRVCADCELLSNFPAMPLGQWPTSPGAGDTTCSVGCRCSWDTWPLPLADNYSPTLTSDQSALVDVLAERQIQALSDMMAEAVYLS